MNAHADQAAAYGVQEHPAAIRDFLRHLGVRAGAYRMFLRQLAKLHLSVLKEANQWYDQCCSSHAGASSGMYGKKLLSKARLLAMPPGAPVVAQKGAGA